MAGFLTLVLAGPAAVAADTYFVTPQAEAGGDGSAGRPWPTVAAALASGRLAGGDTLTLTAGAQGPLDIAGAAFKPPLTIAAAQGAPVHVEWIRIRNSSGLTLSGFEVWPADPPQTVKPAVVWVEKSASAITLADLDIRGWPGAEDYYGWTAEDWLSRRNKGAQIDGNDVTLRDSRLMGVTSGIGVSGTGAQVIGNEVRGFSKDGMRVINSNALIRGNTIRDCIKVDKNHPDGIQSWARRGGAPDLVQGVVVENNRIIQWTGPENPLTCGLQGISLFNGPYESWLIQNNLVLVTAHQGIALYDVRDSRVVNNTVSHLLGTPGKQPWIRLKPGRVADGNVVANNIAQAIHVGKEAWPWPNAVLQNPAREFRDIGRGDYRLAPGSRYANRADPRAAPNRDIDGAVRPQGGGADFGAFEQP